MRVVKSDMTTSLPCTPSHGLPYEGNFHRHLGRSSGRTVQYSTPHYSSLAHCLHWSVTWGSNCPGLRCFFSVGAFSVGRYITGVENPGSCPVSGKPFSFCLKIAALVIFRCRGVA
jgi:hypothetical protein